ncbi:hypothetical protein A8990_11090 [Paenibacillus taihuensis]|uniref:Uncharacterized protein n=1 Tax=Paenibacillus taihuensis TaxID=1156355 RepID=A0A3D9S849_9BACL|nr:hypothetical protein [Paenibacillus taihuensis]REE86481.1 hypothetical protein A8990_11090 [Paenibacillus taihuensis]
MASATTSAGKMTKGCEGCRRVPVRTVFTTGILRRNPGTNFALVDLVNLGKTIAREMKVEVFDWSSGLPVPLTLTPCNQAACLVSLAPGMSNFVFADVSNAQFKYEVRISRRTVNFSLNLCV